MCVCLDQKKNGTLSLSLSYTHTRVKYDPAKKAKILSCSF